MMYDVSDCVHIHTSLMDIFRFLRALFQIHGNNKIYTAAKLKLKSFDLPEDMLTRGV